MTTVMETLTDPLAPRKTILVAVVGAALAFELMAFAHLGLAV